MDEAIDTVYRIRTTFSGCYTHRRNKNTNFSHSLACESRKIIKGPVLIGFSLLSEPSHIVICFSNTHGSETRCTDGTSLDSRSGNSFLNRLATSLSAALARLTSI